MKIIKLLRSENALNLFASLLTTIQSSREKQFLYDIVANGRNGIDVDK